MADSAITKKALANALKQLMSENHFSKISISDICGLCNMNRKSFYYHFQDKYDLVNRIFDAEFACRINDMNGTQAVLKTLCEYLYDNRDFYKCAFKIEGQNSLRSHFCDVVSAYLTRHVCNASQKSSKGELEPMRISFLTDGIVCAIERWILECDCDSPDEFCTQLTSVCSF